MMGTLKVVNFSEMIFSKNIRKKPNLHSKEASERLGYTYYLFIVFLSFHFISFPFSSSTSKLQAKTNQTRSVLITLVTKKSLFFIKLIILAGSSLLRDG